VRTEKQVVYLSAATLVKRVIHSREETHIGSITVHGQRINVVEMYDPLEEDFYWTSVSHSVYCILQGHILLA